MNTEHTIGAPCIPKKYLEFLEWDAGRGVVTNGGGGGTAP